MLMEEIQGEGHEIRTLNLALLVVRKEGNHGLFARRS